MSFLLYHVLCSAAFPRVPEASQNTEGRKEDAWLGWAAAPSLSGSCRLRGKTEGVNHVGLVLKLGDPGGSAWGFSKKVLPTSELHSVPALCPPRKGKGRRSGSQTSCPAGLAACHGLGPGSAVGPGSRIRGC